MRTLNTLRIAAYQKSIDSSFHLFDRLRKWSHDEERGLAEIKLWPPFAFCSSTKGRLYPLGQRANRKKGEFEKLGGVLSMPAEANLKEYSSDQPIVSIDQDSFNR